MDLLKTIVKYGIVSIVVVVLAIILGLVAIICALA